MFLTRFVTGATHNSWELVNIVRKHCFEILKDSVVISIINRIF